MQKFNIIAGATLVAAIALTLGMGTYAQETNDTTSYPSMKYMRHLDEHTIEEREEWMNEMEARHADVEAAIEAGDYNAWTQAVTGTPHGDAMAEAVSEDEFPRLIEAHQLMETAREQMDQARTIMEELGVEHPGMGGGRGHGFGRWK